MKKKEPSQRLKEFEAACLKEVERLNLKDWTIYFEEKRLDDKLASVNYDYQQSVATVFLDTKKQSDKSLKQLATHEMLHLLISRLDGLVTSQSYRNVHEDETYRENERIVKVLEKCIPEIP